MELPPNFRIILIPLLMILVVPFIVYIPKLQQQQILRLVNETVALVRNQTLRHGPENPGHSE